MRYVIAAFIRSLFMHQQGGLRMTQSNHRDLVILKEFIESGKIKPVIDRTYPLEKLPEAMAYAEQGHVAGKVVITVR
jgi:NADPH:quinone reductase-like Zn-dependent oxidoreductase